MMLKTTVRIDADPLGKQAELDGQLPQAPGGTRVQQAETSGPIDGTQAAPGPENPAVVEQAGQVGQVVPGGQGTRVTIHAPTYMRDVSVPGYARVMVHENSPPVTPGAARMTLHGAPQSARLTVHGTQPIDSRPEKKTRAKAMKKVKKTAKKK